MNKPVRRATTPDSLPPIDSDGEDEDDWSSGAEEVSSNASSIVSDEEVVECSDIQSNSEAGSDVNSDAEMPYELAPRKMKVEKEDNKVPRLPIKLADGKIRSTGTTTIPARSDSEEEASSEEEEQEVPAPPREDASTGARFGRPAVAAVLQTRSRKHRIELAKEQIAGICQEIMADPEHNVSSFHPLHEVSLA